ncbi:hypothetical protein niasHS_002879 [Heterodera schachtii]|uniref:RWD domain-containing protein n=1 Tax=Heterodera schachtii TaxID=97005 RepID=A0ABD2K9H9_HETSC
MSASFDDELQLEMQSVEAIFPNEIHIESARQISVKCAAHVQLNLNIPADYPSAPPSVEICAPSVSGEQKRLLLSALDAVVVDYREGPMLYPLIEGALEFFAEHRQKDAEEKDQSGAEEKEPYASADEETCAEFFAGPTIEDRKSKFQAYVAKIESKDQVEFLLTKIKGVGKIARATHNPYAWRLLITPSSKNEQQNAGDQQQRLISLHDCDDDGEHLAGSKLLQLLENMNAHGVLVIVSRYYGGRKLGPDRFKHICNAAREAMLLGGFIKEAKKS